MFSTAELPDLSKIKINDPLWSKYTNMVADVIIPYQWDILNDRIPDAEPSHCLDNFRIAAGEMKGEHKGVVFIDTDVYKWLESVAYSIHNGLGTRFESVADDVIGLIGRAQQSDGYLNTYYTIAEPNSRWSNLVEGHELYSAGHLIEAAVAYYEATGKGKLLKVARRFADLICKVFGPEENQMKGYPGHQEIELALVKLYRCTGEKRYLSCAKFFIEERGKTPSYFDAEIKKRNGRMLFPELRGYRLIYSQSHMPVREQRTAEGHAVRATYMYCAMSDIASEYGDQELLDVCRALWQNITQRRMYITGGIGSSGVFERFTTDYHLPNDSAYCETCASIGLALFGRRLSLIERDAGYYDVVERALYNTVLAGIGVEGDRYFYVNPLEVKPEACMEATSLSHVKPVRQRWFTVACCPTNIARTLASLGRYIYSQDKKSVYINMFISSSFDAAIAGRKAEIAMEADLMGSGEVTVTIKALECSDFNIAIRIPEYAVTPDFFINNTRFQPNVEKGYAIIPCSNSDIFVIKINLHVKPRWIMADPLVWKNAGKVALTKGPFVYCLEETDNGGNLASVFANTDEEVEENFDIGLPGGLPALVYKGNRLSRRGCDGIRLYSDAHFEMEPTALIAVPYCVWGNRTPGEMLVWQKAIMR